jgi:hypothetical protein
MREQEQEDEDRTIETFGDISLKIKIKMTKKRVK